jgi:GDP-L-fucose synthase
MDLQDKIYVAGHGGLVGSAILRRLRSMGYGRLVVRSHAELDLTDSRAVADFFESERPAHVVLAAAKVGGILANRDYPADFIGINLEIQSNVIRESYRAGVRRLLFLGSSCIYPRDCPQPIKEDYLLSGPLEWTNRSYALAKIAGIETCWAYNRQYGTRYFCAMPTNLYGPGDNFDLNNSHVIPGMMRKMHEAKLAGAGSVELWGTGSPRREFLYSDDMAAACVHLMQLGDDGLGELVADQTQAPLVNVGCGEDVTIRELSALVAKAVGFEGEVRWNTDKPDGTPRKLLDVSRINQLGWKPSTDLLQGLGLTYSSYVQGRVQQGEKV